MDVERSASTHRAAIHAALADPYRLEIVDELAMSDRSPTELGRSLAIGSNLLAHHLGVLEEAGLIERHASDGDARRRYVRLVPDALSVIAEPVATLVARHVLFVCSANSARSQLAAAVWNARHEVTCDERRNPSGRPHSARSGEGCRASGSQPGGRPPAIDRRAHRVTRCPRSLRTRP
jgi:ArsR family transcriptional regulator, arsenate/arsenite/antimonite-responsive transcriptional repressor / arsenate reductase (thioredoxin)